MMQQFDGNNNKLLICQSIIDWMNSETSLWKKMKKSVQKLILYN